VDPNHPTHPLAAYWGKYHSLGQRNASIRLAFNVTNDVDNVKYYGKNLSGLELASLASRGRLADAESSITMSHKCGGRLRRAGMRTTM
jgi:hypothetical protein